MDLKLVIVLVLMCGIPLFDSTPVNREFKLVSEFLELRNILWSPTENFFCKETVDREGNPIEASSSPTDWTCKVSFPSRFELVGDHPIQYNFWCPLTRHQNPGELAVCRSDPRMPQIYEEATNLADFECRKHMSSSANEWLCPEYPRLTEDESPGTAEAGFIKALYSAAFTFKLQVACAQCLTNSTGCVKDYEVVGGKLRYNTSRGNRCKLWARDQATAFFLNNKWTTQVDRHNIKLGIMLVTKLTKPSWDSDTSSKVLTVPNFSSFANKIMSRYHNAEKAYLLSNDITPKHDSGVLLLDSDHVNHVKPRPMLMIYMKNSPTSYCKVQKRVVSNRMFSRKKTAKKCCKGSVKNLRLRVHQSECAGRSSLLGANCHQTEMIVHIFMCTTN